MSPDPSIGGAKTAATIVRSANRQTERSEFSRSNHRYMPGLVRCDLFKRSENSCFLTY
jgi:hypothetical protein